MKQSIMLFFIMVALSANTYGDDVITLNDYGIVDVLNTYHPSPNLLVGSSIFDPRIVKRACFTGGINNAASIIKRTLGEKENMSATLGVTYDINIKVEQNIINVSGTVTYFESDQVLFEDVVGLNIGSCTADDF